MEYEVKRRIISIVTVVLLLASACVLLVKKKPQGYYSTVYEGMELGFSFESGSMAISVDGMQYGKEEYSMRGYSIIVDEEKFAHYNPFSNTIIIDIGEELEDEDLPRFVLRQE